MVKRHLNFWCNRFLWILLRLWSHVNFAPLSSEIPGHAQHLFAHRRASKAGVCWLRFIIVTSCSTVFCLFSPGVFLSLAQPTEQARRWEFKPQPRELTEWLLLSRQDLCRISAPGNPGQLLFLLWSVMVPKVWSLAVIPCTCRVAQN